MAIRSPKSFLLANEAEQPPRETALLRDQDLLAAFRRGDRDAFATLYKRYAPTIFRFAFYMAGDADSADEITQEVFVWLIHHPATFDPTRGSLSAFLGGVARKFLRRQQRARSRWSPLEDAIHALRAASIPPAPLLNPESALDAAQVRQAIALLPIRYREVVVLCDLQENEYAEAARTLACSVGTVRSRLNRGRSLLARKLNPSSAKGGRHAL